MKKISVIIPVYHAPNWLDLCLECVCKSTIIDKLEIIVVCNNNTLSIKEILSKYKIDKIVTLEVNLGTAAAFNEGALSSTCPILCFLHTDTLVSPYTFENLLSSFQELRIADHKIIGTIPVTNYAMEHNLIYSNDWTKKYSDIKLSNKSLPSKNDILNLLDSFYDSEQKGLEAFFEFSDKIFSQHKDLYNILIEISHYCLMLDKNAFFELGMFDVDFYPIGYFEKLFYEKALRTEKEIHLCRGVYVHHNGNTSSDTFGFDHSQILDDSKNLFLKKKKLIQELEMEQLSIVLESKRKKQLERYSKLSNTIEHKNLNSALFIRHGGIGDIIMTLPFVLDLKKSHPSCKISYMASPENRGLLESFNGLIDSFIETKDIPTNENWMELLLKNRGFSLFFDTIYDWTFYPETSESSKTSSRIDIFAEKYGKLPKIEFPEATLHSNSNIDSLMAKSQKLIVLAPSATTAARTISPEIVEKICLSAKDKYGNDLKIALVDSIEQPGILGENIINLTGQLSLTDLMYLINISSAVISVDTGVFHMAALFNKPCLGLFGSIPPELRSKYYKNKIEVIYQKEQLKCIPCFDHGCDSMPCLNNFNMEEFLQKLDLLINHDD